MSSECHLCFLRQAMNEMDMSELDEPKKRVILTRVLSLLEGASYESEPTAIAHGIHMIIQGQGGDTDPYLELKRRSNERAMEIYPGLLSRVRSADDPLREAILLATCGNVIDYGAKNLLDLEETIQKAERKGFSVDDYSIFSEEEKRARTIYYIVDNSGEIILDKLLIGEVLRRRGGRRIKVVVKKDPVLNDITASDAREVGIHEIDGVEIMEIPDAGWITPDHLKEFKDADMIISKGQGNFEGLSEVKGIFFLLVCKCEIVGEFLGVGVGDMILKYSGG